MSSTAAAGRLRQGRAGGPARALRHRVATDDGVAPLDEATRSRCDVGDAAALADDALRVLAVATATSPSGPQPEALDDGLTFVGLIGMIDPLREEASRRSRGAARRASAPS